MDHEGPIGELRNKLAPPLPRLRSIRLNRQKINGINNQEYMQSGLRHLIQTMAHFGFDKEDHFGFV